MERYLATKTAVQHHQDSVTREAITKDQMRDIDLENKVINIYHQLQRTSDMRLVIESTKINAGTQ